MGLVRINDKIEQCLTISRRVDKSERTGVAVHRITTEHLHDPRWPPDAEGIARFFREHADVRNVIGRMPYNVIVLPDGSIEQALPLLESGPHARAWNRKMIAVAVSGDFSGNPVPGISPGPPTVAAYQSLTALCGILIWWLNATPDENLKGHDELPEGSSDPDKECPGEYLSMDDLRADVEEWIDSNLDVSADAVQRDRFLSGIPIIIT